MKTKTVKLEIVPQELGLDKPSTLSLESAFEGFFQGAEEWKGKAEIITDPKEARTARLELKGLRVSAEKKRKELKAESLRMGKAIDGANNILLAVIVPLEQKFEAIEKAEERRKADELAKLVACRTDKIRKFIDSETPIPNMATLTDEQFDSALSDAETLFNIRAEIARKAAEEVAKREAEEAAERVRVAAENEKLRKEAAAREKAIQEEREEAEAVRAKEAAKAAAELKKVEAAAALEKKKADAIAAKEAAAREKAEAEAQAMRDERLMVANQLAKAKDDAEKAPDKEKLTALAESIRSLKNPTLTSKGGKAITKTISEQIEKFASWVEREAGKI